MLHIKCGSKCLNPFFRLHEANEVLNKYVMGVWSDYITAAVFVSFVTVFVPESAVAAQLCLPQNAYRGTQWRFLKKYSDITAHPEHSEAK